VIFFVEAKGEKMNINPHVFPTILIILDFCSAAVWLSHGDFRKMIYWTAAGVLSLTVTW